MSQEESKAQSAVQASQTGQTSGVGAEVGGDRSKREMSWKDERGEMTPEHLGWLKARRRVSACTQVCQRSEGQGDGSAQTGIRTPEKIRKLQRTLYRKAKAQPKYRFWSLYGDIMRRDLLEHALQRVAANGGAGGVDGQTIERKASRAARKNRANGWTGGNGNSRPRPTGPVR